MTDPTPEERAPFGFKNTEEFVVWLSAERIDVAVKALDAAHANMIHAAVAAETERCADVWPLSVACSMCGALARQWCREPSSASTTQLCHDVRWQAAIRGGEDD
jgi:hypothetical protein